MVCYDERVLVVVDLGMALASILEMVVSLVAPFALDASTHRNDVEVASVVENHLEKVSKAYVVACNSSNCSPSDILLVAPFIWINKKMKKLINCRKRIW